MSKSLVAQSLNTEPANILTAKEAAVILGIRHRSVLKAVSRGTLVGIRAGNQWYFEIGQVNQYKTRQTNRSTS